MLRSALLSAGIASAVLAAPEVLADGPQAPARTQLPNRAAAAQVAGENRRQPPTKPPGAPDYTKITGFIEDANLPIEQPTVLWTASSDSVDGNGQIKMNSLTDAVVANGVLYFGDDQGNVIAFSTKDKSAARQW